MTKSQEEVFSKEGEIKILRERLRSAESDLTTVRKERIHMLDEEKKKYSEELRNWRTETESLKTQLHFKGKLVFCTLLHMMLLQNLMK